MFLKLTSATTNEQVRINVNSIVSYEFKDKKTYTLIIMGNTTHVMVKETPHEIDGLLASAYVMVKEGYENRTSEVSQHSTDSQLDDSEQLQSGSCGSSCEHCSCL